MGGLLDAPAVGYVEYFPTSYGANAITFLHTTQISFGKWMWKWQWMRRRKSGAAFSGSWLHAADRSPGFKTPDAN